MHKQTAFKAPDGTTYNVDRKMKRTVVAMNQAGYKTKYSDQGDFRIKDHTKDAYVSWDDPKGEQAKELRGKLPKRFKVEHHEPETFTGRLHGETKDRQIKTGGDSDVRFRGGPGFGIVNRAKLRREIKKDAFGVVHNLP